MIVMLWLAVQLAWPSRGPEMAVGFVNHYPMICHMDDRLAESGANVITMRAPWPLIEPTEGRFDFSVLDQQLELVSRQGIKVVVLLEAGPAHAANVPWLMDKLRTAGHTQVDPDGNPCKDPSIFSPIYKSYLRRYLRRVTAYLKSHRLATAVYGYNNGCEWWYPISQSYGSLAEEAFRGYLRSRYRTLSKLNAAWGAHVTSWTEIRAPKLAWLGSNRSSQACMVPYSARLDACYATTAASHVPVRPGQTVTFTVQWKGSAMRAGGIVAEIAWLDGKKPQPLDIVQSPLCVGDAPAVCRAVAPPGAERAWLLAKSMAVGEVTFTRLSCLDEQGTELAPNPELDPTHGGWQFIQWSAGEPDRVAHSWNEPGAARIRYDSSLRLETPCELPLAAVCDWTDFRARAMAKFIDWMGAEIRASDPCRPVVSYLTFAFANPFEWDYAQQMAIQIEHWAPAARHQQILGMQLSSGEGDFDSVTCALDIVRKYGKPMWAVDLLDFTRGTALGAGPLTALSKAVVDHGGTGIQYYCWWGTPHYDYLDLGMEALSRMIRETRAYATSRRPHPLLADVVLVLPRMPLYGALPEPPNDWADFMGWYKLLRRLDVRADVYTLEELTRDDLTRHRVIIVPDCAYIRRDSLEALARAAKKGVRLISSGRLGLYDMRGVALHYPAENLGARRFTAPLGAELLGEAYRQPTPTDTPPRLVCRANSPLWDSEAPRTAALALHEAGIGPGPGVLSGARK